MLAAKETEPSAHLSPASVAGTCWHEQSPPSPRRAEIVHIQLGRSGTGCLVLEELPEVAGDCWRQQSERDRGGHTMHVTSSAF